MSKSVVKAKIMEDGIYYTPEADGSTHFVSVKNNKIKDPYKYYQFPNTHGFCQLFAFFLHIEDTNEFQKINFNNKLTVNNFEKYSHNSFQCLQKLISILKNTRYENVKNALRLDLKTMDKEFYGIKPRTSVKRFLNDLEKLKLEQAKVEVGEVFEMYVKYNKPKKLLQNGVSEEIRKQYERQEDDFQTNEKLCVKPTTGESQYEAFQAIIAYSFSADKNSPYSKLLEDHDIKLIQSA